MGLRCGGLPLSGGATRGLWRACRQGSEGQPSSAEEAWWREICARPARPLTSELHKHRQRCQRLVGEVEDSQRDSRPQGQSLGACCDGDGRGAPFAFAESAVLHWPPRLANSCICSQGPHLARRWCAEQGWQAPLAAAWGQLAQLQQPALGPFAWHLQAAGGWGLPHLDCVPWAPRRDSQLHPLQTQRASQNDIWCSAGTPASCRHWKEFKARWHRQQHFTGMTHLPDAAGHTSWPKRLHPPQQAPQRT